MTNHWVKGISRDLLRTAFRDYFGIYESSATLLVELYQAGRDEEGLSNPVPVKDLCYRLSSHRSLNAGALYERVRVLRAAMSPEAIEQDNSNYWLTDVGFDDAAGAIRDLARTLTKDFVVENITPAPKVVSIPAKPKVRQLCADTLLLPFGQITEALSSAGVMRLTATA
jgi:hypothetical protein